MLIFTEADYLEVIVGTAVIVPVVKKGKELEDEFTKTKEA